MQGPVAFAENIIWFTLVVFVILINGNTHDHGLYGTL